MLYPHKNTKNIKAVWISTFIKILNNTVHMSLLSAYIENKVYFDNSLSKIINIMKLLSNIALHIPMQFYLLTSVT